MQKTAKPTVDEQVDLLLKEQAGMILASDDMTTEEKIGYVLALCQTPNDGNPVSLHWNDSDLLKVLRPRITNLTTIAREKKSANA